MTIETEREDDGRWIAAQPKLPGVMVYGVTEADARRKAIMLVRQVLVDRVAAGEALRLPTARSRQ